jgi:hypothetical protein
MQRSQNSFLAKKLRPNLHPATRPANQLSIVSRRQRHGFTEDEEAALVTREAHQALLDLKRIWTQLPRGQTIGLSHFDAPVSKAQLKIEAVASHLTPEDGG